jgi:hypothetical protein
VAHEHLEAARAAHTAEATALQAEVEQLMARVTALQVSQKSPNKSPDKSKRALRSNSSWHASRRCRCRKSALIIALIRAKEP